MQTGKRMDGRGELVVIFRTPSDIEARVVCSLLDAHGIRSMICSDMPHAIFPLSVDEGEVRLSVNAESADEARRVIAAHRAEMSRGEVVPFGTDLDRLEAQIGYRFHDRYLLERALTHRSRANEDETGATVDNESLEFLGDAVLGFVMADTIFRQFPEYDEGRKSKIKASLVSTPALARLARAIDLGEFLVLGRGEEKTGGRKKQALLADGYEALIAAIYLDGGIDAARAFVVAQVKDLLTDVGRPDFSSRDHKSVLQEFLQGQNQPLPVYEVVAETGPDHHKLFEVRVLVKGEVIAAASGRSKKDAEQAAAEQALQRLGRLSAGTEEA